MKTMILLYAVGIYGYVSVSSNKTSNTPTEIEGRLNKNKIFKIFIFLRSIYFLAEIKFTFISQQGFNIQ